MKTALKRYAGLSDSDPLLTWLNAAYHEFEDAVSWPFLETESNFVQSAADNDITLPADYFRPIYLLDVTSKNKLSPWDSRKVARDIPDPTESGKPQVYYLINTNVFRLWPVPDAALNMSLLYEKFFPDLVNDADVPLIPVRYHYAIVLGAAAYALMAESEEDRAGTARSLYDGFVDRATTKFGVRQLDENLEVEDTQGYFED
jgi:hypothetical protein